MLLEQWQAWSHDCFPGELVPLLDQWTLPQYLIWTVGDAAVRHSLVSYHQTLERRGHHFPLCFLPWGSCRQQWDHPSASSKLNKPTMFSHSAEVMPSRPFIIFAVILWTHSSIFISFLHSESWNCTQYLRWGCTSAEYSWAIVSTFPQLVMLCLMIPRIQLALLSSRAYCWLILSWSSNKPSRSLFAGLHSRLLSPSLYVHSGLHSQVQNPVFGM